MTVNTNCYLVEQSAYSPRHTSPRCVDMQATKFCTMVPNIFSIITAVLFLAYGNVYQFTCTRQKAPDNREVHTSLQNGWSSVWNLFHIMLMVHKIWMWLLHFWKICAPLVMVHS